jgi:hypothetical protein
MASIISISGVKQSQELSFTFLILGKESWILLIIIYFQADTKTFSTCHFDSEQESKPHNEEFKKWQIENQDCLEHGTFE